VCSALAGHILYPPLTKTLTTTVTAVPSGAPTLTSRREYQILVAGIIAISLVGWLLILQAL
jgi:hypothetical protein